MERISEIKINNFKFFPESKPIRFDGNNILLYGENGSGKSSLYWALYTLLESSNKANPTDIEKYFNPADPASLVNIYAPRNPAGFADSYITVKLTNGKRFVISHGNTRINKKQDIKISNYVSDFINYRLLQRAHNVKHSSTIDLFPLFEDSVFNYLQFPPINWQYPGTPAPIPVINGGEIWGIIKKGPPQTYSRKRGTNDSYPLKTRHRAAYNEFRQVVDGFHNGLNGVMGRINPIANNILQNKLNYSITFRLTLEQISEFTTSENQYHKPKYKINLFIDDYFGQGPAINKPQSFLNEAKLSAISLSIRLAILEMRLPDSLIKILLLDDLLVSLDMTNRDKVTKLFLNEYAWWFDPALPVGNQNKGHQTIILTHDRSYYTFVKHEIDNLPEHKKEKWKLIEIYADDIDPTIPNDFEKPRVFDFENELRTAFRHFKNHDYPSAANYQRKYAEGILSKKLPEFCWKENNKEDKSNFKIPLYNIIDKGIDFWESFGINPTAYKELRKYVSVLLNPLSHADVGVERYKQEIKEVDKILKEIDLFHLIVSYKSLISGGETLQVRLSQAGTTNLFTAEYILKSSLYCATYQGNTYFSSFKGKAVRSYILSNTGQISNVSNVNGNDKEMIQNYAEFCALPAINIPAVPDWHRFLFNSQNVQLITLI